MQVHNVNLSSVTTQPKSESEPIEYRQNDIVFSCSDAVLNKLISDLKATCLAIKVKELVPLDEQRQNASNSSDIETSV